MHTRTGQTVPTPRIPTSPPEDPLVEALIGFVRSLKIAADASTARAVRRWTTEVLSAWDVMPADVEAAGLLVHALVDDAVQRGATRVECLIRARDAFVWFAVRHDGGPVPPSARVRALVDEVAAGAEWIHREEIETTWVRLRG